MKLEEMEIEDLLCDDSFIRYCKRSSSEDISRWESLSKESPDNSLLIEKARERYLQIFNALANADLQEQENRLISRMGEIQTAPVLVMHERQKDKARSIFSMSLKIAVSAVILAAIFLGIKYSQVSKKDTFKSFTANYGERKNFQLPDGSVVILNGGSKITIKHSYGKTSRDIYLEGEAFFDVRHNKDLPFIVHTKAMDVKALGTAFNVNAYPGGMVTETSLVRGLIEVTLNEEKYLKVLLYPNQKLQWGALNVGLQKNEFKGEHNEVSVPHPENLIQELTKTDEGDIKETAWTENKLVFTDNTFEEIAVLLERWYGVKIVFIDDMIRNYRFTGIFEKEELLSVLDVLKEAKFFRYKIISGEVNEIELFK